MLIEYICIIIYKSYVYFFLKLNKNYDLVWFERSICIVIICRVFLKKGILFKDYF